MIEGYGLRKSFGERLILDDIGFSIPDGALVGLCGKSGIGKSTLAKLLCGVLAPEDGELRLDGELLCSPTRPYDRRRGLRIQMAYQQPYAALDSRQRLRAGFYELIRYHKLAPNRAAADDLISGLLSQAMTEAARSRGMADWIAGHVGNISYSRTGTGTVNLIAGVFDAQKAKIRSAFSEGDGDEFVNTLISCEVYECTSYEFYTEVLGIDPQLLKH